MLPSIKYSLKLPYERSLNEYHVACSWLDRYYKRSQLTILSTSYALIIKLSCLVIPCSEVLPLLTTKIHFSTFLGLCHPFNGSWPKRGSPDCYGGSRARKQAAKNNWAANKVWNGNLKVKLHPCYAVICFTSFAAFKALQSMWSIYWVICRPWEMMDPPLEKTQKETVGKQSFTWFDKCYIFESFSLHGDISNLPSLCICEPCPTRHIKLENWPD